VKDLGVGLGRLEQTPDGVTRPRRRIERGCVLTHTRVRGERIDPGDGEQLATALVQVRADAQKRFQASSEATARPAGALGDRRPATVLEGVDVQDPVGLAIADRSQHDRLVTQRPRHAERPSPLGLSLMKS
jgi:hypothetical protein